MKKFIILFTMLIFSKLSFAEYAVSRAEIMQMPPFCRGLSIQNFQADAKDLKKNITMPGEHTQHFCHGMKAIVRKNYETAVQEFGYVQGHSTSQHVLLPATSLYKAEALGKSGKIAEALTEYNKAIQLKNTYVQAYKKLSEYYISLKQKDNAIETLKLGLKYSPNSKSLKKRLKALQK
ncbi:MAG: hypothetical protein GQ532_10975 [Methylomarinum sp.]|nr:hypothetical protein [Methylomarinum sp.]